MTVPVSADRLLALRESDVPHRYDERDTIRYALSIGMGRDPCDKHELGYLFEGYLLRVVPTMGIAFARQKLIWDVGLDIPRFLHGEQRLTIHRPLPPAGELLGDAWIEQVHDRGAGKGSILEIHGLVRDAASREPYFDWSALIFARGDGGIGGSPTRPPGPHPIPERSPDMSFATATRADQALLYRLNGDSNLIHVDPDIARGAGFPRPILHGACTYAIACREVLAHVCDYDATRIRAFDVRFTAPVFPGETVRTDLWLDGDTVSFRAHVEERGVTVLDHGRCLLAPRGLR